MSEQFDPADFSFVVKRRGSLPKPWRWEIYRAGKNDPLERSAVFFESMAEALKEGKKPSGPGWRNRWRASGGPATNNQGIKSTDKATILQWRPPHALQRDYKRTFDIFPHLFIRPRVWRFLTRGSHPGCAAASSPASLKPPVF